MTVENFGRKVANVLKESEGYHRKPSPRQSLRMERSPFVPAHHLEGSFLSPQPLSAQLVRCASTPLGESGFRVLGTIDFEQFENKRESKDVEKKETDKTSTPRLPAWEKRNDGSVRIHGDEDSGLHESQV